MTGEIGDRDISGKNVGSGVGDTGSGAKVVGATVAVIGVNDK